MRKQWFLLGVVLFLLPWLVVGCGIGQEEYDAVAADLGKAQEELESVKGELEAAQGKNSELTSSLGKSQTELKAVQAELEAAQAKTSELTSSLEESQTELKAAQTKTSELTSNLEESQTELKAAQAKTSKLTSSLGKSQTELKAVQAELEATEAEYEVFKSDLKSSWGSLDGDLKLNSAILSIIAAMLLDNLDVIPSRATTVTGVLATLGDAELQALWGEAYVTDSGRWELRWEPFETFMAKHHERISSKANAIRDKLTE